MPKLINGPEKNKGGRPQIEIDLKKVEMLARIMATDEEIAVFLGCSRNSIKRVKKRKDYQEAIERGRVFGRMSIRRKQFQLLDAGERGMAYYLGKAILGQSDSGFGVSTDPISEIKVTIKRPKKPD